MITYNIEKKGNDPIYVYLYKSIRQDILDGKFKANEKMPSKRALANNLNIGVNTVANAYEQLLSEGYLYSYEKRGYFVTDMKKFGDIHINTESPKPTVEEEEPKYFMDFRANRLNLKNFPISIWNKCMRKVANMDSDALYKTVPYNGVLELRNAIAKYLYKNKGMSVDAKRIVIGAGTEYLYRRLFEMFNRDVQFAIEDTGFKKLYEHCDIYNAKAIIIPTDKEGMKVSKLKQSSATLAYVSPANRFPTGRIMPIKKRLELFEWVYKNDERFIIEDDYDSEFRYSGKMILPMYAEDTQDKVIYLNTFSKTMVPSLRISYMILPESLLEVYKKSQGFYSCTVSSFEQYALAEFINSGAFDRHINRMRNHYKRQRVNILNEFKNSPLMKIATIEEHNVGTHFLLKVKTNKTKEEIYNEGKMLNLQISFFSDYSVIDVDKKGVVTLVINYAAISSDKVLEVVSRLENIFFKAHT